MAKKFSVLMLLISLISFVHGADLDVDKEQSSKSSLIVNTMLMFGLMDKILALPDLVSCENFFDLNQLSSDIALDLAAAGFCTL